MPADRGRYPPPDKRVALFPGCRSPRRAVRGRSRHRPASDSMPAGSPLTQARRIAADSCPPDAADSSHRIGADSCPLAAAIPSPVESPHVTARSAVCLFCCAHRNFNHHVGLVHGDSSGAGGSSGGGHGGHSSRLPPCRRSVSGLLRDPVRALMSCHARGSLSFQASPGGLLVSLGCPVLSVWPWRGVPVCLYCLVV